LSNMALLMTLRRMGRGDLFEKRRQLAEAWVRYCGGRGESGAEVFALRASN